MHLLIYAALLLGPRAAVTKTPAGHNLVLTVSMLEAIDRWDPTFRPWSDRDYQPGIVRSYDFSAKAAPFATLGDFNGDGRVDVAIHGRTRTRTVLIAVLSEGVAYRVIVIRQSPLADPAKEWYGVGNGKVNYGLDVYLTGQVPAGTYVGGDDERPKRIKFDAFEIEDWEKSSTAYLWNGRRFHAVITSD